LAASSESPTGSPAGGGKDILKTDGREANFQARIPEAPGSSDQVATVDIEHFEHTVMIRVPGSKAFTKEEAWKLINLVYFLVSMHTDNASSLDRSGDCDT
jgi:hypothetical protein